MLRGVFLMCALVGCLCAAMPCQQSRGGGAAPVHVYAEVRELSGEPISTLRASNFSVLSGGSRLPFTLSSRKAKPATYLLIIVSPASGLNSTQAISDLLEREIPGGFPASYSASLLGPKGEYVSYESTRDALVSRWRARAVTYKGYRQAIRDLGTRKGRRAIIYVTGSLSNVPPDLKAAAEAAGALIYQVGGNVNQNYVFSSETTSTRELPEYGEGLYGPTAPSGLEFNVANSTVMWASTGTRSIRTVYVERSMRGAFREMERGMAGSYELRLNVPQGVDEVQLRLRLRGDYQITAYDYSAGEGEAPDLRLAK